MPRPNHFLFLLANFFWSLGLMVFLLLYNLHLADLGFSPSLMGRIFALGAVGTVLGSIPAGWAADRWGPKRLLLVSTAVVGASLWWRGQEQNPALLLAGAFLTGFGISLWIVSVPPFLAANAPAEKRTSRFSSAYGLSILTGSLAGLCGGYLPGWVGMRQSLLACGLSCSVAAIFLIPVEDRNSIARTSASKPHSLASAVSRHKKFLPTFLAMVLVWDLLLGLFPPFFNVFFTRHHGVMLAELGWIFSISQFFQALAVLSLPFWVKPQGLQRTISTCQLICFPPLLLLAFSARPAWAAASYFVSASLQALTSPLIDQFVMHEVEADLRGKIAGMKFFVSQGAVAAAAAAAGEVITRQGYVPLLATASALALLSAVLTLFIPCRRDGVTAQPPRR